MRAKKDTGTGTVTSSSSEGSVGQVRSMLRRQNIYIDDDDAAERGKNIIKRAKKIVTGERKSVLSEDTAKELWSLSRRHSMDTGMTFLVNVWGVLLNQTRWARVTDETIEADEAKEWIENRAWKKDFLECQYDAPFTAGSIPLLALEPDLEALVTFLGADLGKVKIPKPDLTYGLEENAFTMDERAINHTYGARLCLNTDHPFLTVDLKGGGQPLGEAVNQCARAGRATGALQRRFDHAAKGTSDDGNSDSTASPASSSNFQMQ